MSTVRPTPPRNDLGTKYIRGSSREPPAAQRFRLTRFETNVARSIVLVRAKAAPLQAERARPEHYPLRGFAPVAREANDGIFRFLLALWL
jgi:hypothetical protein